MSNLFYASILIAALLRIELCVQYTAVAKPTFTFETKKFKYSDPMDPSIYLSICMSIFKRVTMQKLHFSARQVLDL